MTAQSQVAAPSTELRVALQLFPARGRVLLPGSLLAQIVTDPAISPIPGCAPWFCGVMPRRGTVVPVFDVAAQLAVAAASERRYVLAIESALAPFAIFSLTMPAVVPVGAAPPKAELPETLIPERYLEGWFQSPSSTDMLPAFDVLKWLSDVGPRVLI